MTNRLGACLVAISALVSLSDPVSAESLLPSPLPPACVPVPASELIRWLPPAPENWELVSSIGRSMFAAADKPATMISRHYKFVPPPVPPGETPPEVKLTNIRLLLTDTAYSPDLLGMFSGIDQMAGKSDNYEFKRLAGLPMILTRRRSGENIAIILLGGRMTLTVCGNSDEKDLLAWMKHLPLAELQKKSLDAPRTPFKGTSYLEKFVNQLDPKKNREVVISINPETSHPVWIEGPAPVVQPP